MLLPTTRRSFLLGSAALGLSPLLACTPRHEEAAPVVFVHGNGDTAALWHTTFWRWESNGFPRDKLFAVDFPYPLARRDDRLAQRLHSSTLHQREQLAEFVAEVKRRTMMPKVVLVGSSRGGNAIRNYVKNAGGAAHVSHAVLCGTPNHGVVASNDILPGSEFNGSQPFLQQLNAGPNEVVPGVAWMTTRSDTNDKFAQPDGRYLGMAGKPTNVGFDSPALDGAKNVVLPGLDHREVAFDPLAFAVIWEFVMGEAPATMGIAPEPAPVLNGKVNGMALSQGRAVQTNLPVAGAVVEIYETDPQTGMRRRLAHRQQSGQDGYWGPFRAAATATYEFVVAVPEMPLTHIYRSPFPRSSAIIHLRPGVLNDKEKLASAAVTLSRPRGYFEAGRDIVAFDGQPAPGIPDGVPSVSTSTLLLPAGAPQRGVVCRFNDETIAVQTWPVADNHVVIAELHY